MNRAEIVACIYKHAGRSDDLENLTELAEEIAKMAAEEERVQCELRCAKTHVLVDGHHEYTALNANS